MRRALAGVLFGVAFGRAAVPAVAQDTLRLPALQRAAVAHDPRAQQLELLASASVLRLRNLSAAWLPSLAAHAGRPIPIDPVGICA